MATTAAYKGLVPVNLIGGRPYNGGAMREYKVTANNSAAMFSGDVIALTTAGQPVARTATPTAIKIPSTAADATAGVMGVMVGCRFVDSDGVQKFSQYLPVNSITGGATDVFAGFSLMGKAAKKNGALSEKSKELIALGIAISTL